MNTFYEAIRRRNKRRRKIFLLTLLSEKIDRVPFQLQTLSDSDCVKNFRFTSGHIKRLQAVLRIPFTLRCKGTFCTGIEGWGNIFPMTAWGKAVTCIYALIGIPLLLLYMANIGDLLARSFIGIYVSVERCKERLERFRMERDAITIGHAEEEELTVIDHYVGGQKDKTLITQMRNQDNNKWRTNEMTTMIPISTCLFVFCCYIVLGAVIFSWWEGWDYLEGSYFCFISLVTIGFGDLVPGYRMGESAQQTVDGQLILCSIYILFGMGLMSTLFHLTQERFFIAARKLGTTLHLI